MAVMNYTNDGLAQAAFQTAAASAGLSFTNLSLIGQLQAVLSNMLGSDNGSVLSPVSLGANPPTTGAVRVDASSFGGTVLRSINAGFGLEFRSPGAAAQEINTVGTANLQFGVNSVGLWQVSSPGAGIAAFVSQAATSRFVGGTTTTEFRGTTAGNILFTDAAGSAFNLLQFGGTSNAFPALQRSGAGLNARLADNSGNTFIGVSNIVTTAAAATVGAGQIAWGATTATTVGAAGAAAALPATPSGYVIINVGGTPFKIAYYAN